MPFTRIEPQVQTQGIERTLKIWVEDGQQNPTLGNIPANAWVTEVRISVTQAFNSDGSDEIRVGYDSDEDAYATLTAVNTTGKKSVTLGAGANYDTTARVAEAYYVNGGSEPTAGKAIVILKYDRLPPSP